MKLVIAIAIVVTSVAVLKAEDVDMSGTYLKDEYIVIPSVTVDDKGDTYRHINPDIGTIEFWLKPDWKLDDMSENDRHKDIFFWGDCTYHNSIWINRNWDLGTIITSQGNKQFELMFYAQKLKKLEFNTEAMTWHHIAICWDMTGAKKGFKMFLDGKTKGDGLTVGAVIPNMGIGENNFFKRWKIAETEFDGIKTDKDMYLGTAIVMATKKPSNFLPGFEVAQFRVSDIVRYDDEFSPKPKLSADKSTLLYIPLTDNLDGEYYKSGKKVGKIRGKQIQIEVSKKK
jgi:hypothetical protein